MFASLFKNCVATVVFLCLPPLAGLAQHPDSASIPDNLKGPFAILMRSYPRLDAKKFPRPPADSAWLFRAATSAVGTVEVGFQGDQVVYMILRRGVGGYGWKPQEIHSLHDLWCHDLLRESQCGDTYYAELASQINAAIIIRKDFDPKPLLSGT